MNHKENKRKWVNKTDFSKFGKASVSKHHYISNYVSMTPSLPPIEHKFREIRKEKWIGKQNFCI